MRTFYLYSTIDHPLTTIFIVQKQVKICSSVLDACDNADAIVIATEWKEFREIDWETVYQRMSKPAFVFDGRLLVDYEQLTKIGFKVGVVFGGGNYD